jgi:hypothetical protein
MTDFESIYTSDGSRVDVLPRPNDGQVMLDITTANGKKIWVTMKPREAFELGWQLQLASQAAYNS